MHGSSVCAAGTDVGQLRSARVDTRWGALADCDFVLHGGVVCLLCADILPAVARFVTVMTDSKTKTAAALERKKEFTTLSGLPVERLYTPESLGPWQPETVLSYPGEYPYTRGIYPTMYRG